MTSVVRIVVPRAAPRLHGSRIPRARLAALLSATVMLPQCRTAPDTEAVGGRPQGVDRYVTMERGPCYGSCPIYTVRVDGDGEVRFHGTANVAIAGESVSRIPSTRVDSLFGYVDRIGLGGFESSYTFGTTACGAYVTDLPTVVVAVVRFGVAKRVAHDYGCGDAPDTLYDLHRYIDEVAGTHQWIGGQ